MQFETLIEFAIWVNAAPLNISRAAEDVPDKPSSIRIVQRNKVTNAMLWRILELNNDSAREVAQFKIIIKDIDDEVNGSYEREK